MLAKSAEQRGKDSSGLFAFYNQGYFLERANFQITKLLKRFSDQEFNFMMGHSRLITNGHKDNQPVLRNEVVVIHNGIIVNDEVVWKNLSEKRRQEIDTELIGAIALEHLDKNGKLGDLPLQIYNYCEGTISCAIAFPRRGKLLLFSNNGSLYYGEKGDFLAFASEEYQLKSDGYNDIKQVWEPLILEIPQSELIDERPDRGVFRNLVPKLILHSSEEKLLAYPKPQFRRCSRCVLPETMPFINFDEKGVCNYCRNYKVRNSPKPKSELRNLVRPFRKQEGQDCIVPFSGGRDSSYALHLIVKELEMKPITYTYDWGMVTDLARRNISRMCSKLKVENVIIAADIDKKRRNIRKNLQAWLKAPNLGMVSILTAGDKHFFQHLETMKRQTGIDISLWGICPLETTHFKAGFLGIPPDFEEQKVYSSGVRKQLRYQNLRFKAMLKSWGYFNLSLWDTLSGEYFRSFQKKKDYFHIFDYWNWEEPIVDSTLSNYGWELSPDTKTTWRIGDGTAAFYNYVYYTVAGFTEHDTFRSNQIREGQITREEALKLVEEENRPRYANLKWYLDVIGLDFEDTIKTVNLIPRLYKTLL
ncbi:hypothetical protein N9F58_00195 [Akkermansiaceae bacterium]|nr:hypothetical protein [Akkermansiaceae bacterium]